MASTLYGGRGPAILAIVFAGCAFELFFLSSKLEVLHSRASLFRFGVFVGAMVLTMEMIEAKRRSDRARLQVYEEFRSLAETSPDCILTLDRGGVIQFANPALTRMFGFSPNEVQGKAISLLLPDVVGGRPPSGEFTAFRKNGESLDVEASCGAFGDRTTIFLRDISERKRSQKRLEESEESLRLTLETIPGLVYTRSADGTIEYANGRLSEYLGGVSGATAADALAASIHPEERDAVLKQLVHKFAAGLPYTMEYRSRRYDGVYRWLQTRAQPLKNRDGEVIRWYSLLTDIEDLRATEESLRQTQAKLDQASRIATMSELAASIVHEISQPISAMVANGQACLRWLNATPPNASDARTAVERIVRDGKDAADVIKSLRSLFRRSPAEKGSVDLRVIVAEVASLVRGRTDREGIILEIHIPDDLPCILGNKIQLQQVLMNLVANAIDSMQGIADRPKRLMIRARSQDASVLTEIEDSGSGVTDFDRIFEAFVTTKEKGMGMGLSICRSIIEAHSGLLSGRSNVTGGSVFSFTVPCAEGGEFAV